MSVRQHPLPLPAYQTSLALPLWWINAFTSARSCSRLLAAGQVGVKDHQKEWKGRPHLFVPGARIFPSLFSIRWERNRPGCLSPLNHLLVLFCALGLDHLERDTGR